MGKVCSLKCVKLDRLLTLQSVTRTTDSQGGYTDSWANGVSLWGQLTPKRGYERLQLNQVTTAVTHEIIIRYRTGITTAQRFVHNSRVFNIKEVLNIEEADVYLKITAVEMV